MNNLKTAKSICALVDYSHMGRKITGIERISSELFSSEALSQFGVIHTPHASSLGMIRAQWLGIPILAAKYRTAKLLFPGFPPSIFVSIFFGDRVIPYIHDLFLIERKDELNIRARLYMRPSFIYAIKNLNNFFVNSETTRKNLRMECKHDANIMTLRPRAKNVFGFEEKIRYKPSPSEPLRFVMLGTLEPRKNYEFAAKLTAEFSRRSGRSVELHISGREGWGDVAAKLEIFPHVKYHGYLSVTALRELVNKSDLFLCTSLDEGLGLPLLEVLFSGIPMVLSNIPVFKEVASLASSVFISNSDIEMAVSSLKIALDSDELFSSSIVKARQATDSWNSLAESDMNSFSHFMAHPIRMDGYKSI